MASAKRKLGLMLSTASAHPNLETAIGLSRAALDAMCRAYAERGHDDIPSEAELR